MRSGLNMIANQGGLSAAGKKGTLQGHLGRDTVDRCSYTNARSLRANMGELECLVSKENLDIVGITETWWKGENQWDMVIPGYKLYRKGREGCTGGGVVKEGIVSLD